MKAVSRCIVFSGTLLCAISGAEAATKPWLQFPGATNPVDVTFGGGYGTRSGDLQWNIAGDSDGPNILSELSYQGLEFTEFRTFGSVTFNTGKLKNWRFDTSFSNGEATKGDVYDSDYDSDDRQDEYSRSRSSAVGSETTNFDLSAGYRLSLNRAITLTPMAGFAYNTQFLKMSDGEQLLYTKGGGVQLGNFSHELNSHYTTQWMGGWLGFNTGIETEHHALNLQYKFHVAQYHAEANWNLREDFEHPKSFEHWAVGTANVLELNYQWRWSENWSANARAFREAWQTEPGDDVVYLSDGTSGKTDLNVVTWDSAGYDLSLQYVF